MKSNNTARAPNGAPYFPCFDWLRFVLAATVMLGHDHAIGVLSERAPTFAVHVFFVLSGWLIGGILLDLRAGQLPRFFFNRALRIWVPYYVALALVLAVSLLRDGAGAGWARIVIYKLTMVYNLFNNGEILGGFKDAPLHGTAHHFWSVNAEEQFYLMAPLLLVVLWRRGGRHWLVWSLVTVATLFLGADYPGLSLGVVAAIVLKGSDWHRARAGRIALALALLALSPWVIDPATFMAASPFAGLCIVLLLAAPGAQSKLGEVLGGLSYPLYLNHWVGTYFIGALFKRLQLADAVSLRQGVAALFSVLLALLHYWLIDRQIRHRRHLWYSPRAGIVLMSCAYAIFAAGLVFGAAALR